MAADQTPFVVDTYVCLDATSQIFPNASNFSKRRAKKKTKVSTYCYSRYGSSPNLFATTRASMRLSSTITIRQRLSKLTEEHDLPLPLSASKNLERGVINLEGGCAPPLPPKSALDYSFKNFPKFSPVILLCLTYYSKIILRK